MITITSVQLTTYDCFLVKFTDEDGHAGTFSYDFVTHLVVANFGAALIGEHEDLVVLERPAGRHPRLRGTDALRDLIDAYMEGAE